MIRLALVVLASSAVAHAGEPPTFAVQLRSWDKIADKMTYAFADELRAAGRARSAVYRAKGAHEDFVRANTEPCVVTELACAGAIGERLGVDYVLVGEIETRGKRFVLTMNVVSIATKKRVRSLRDVVDRASNAKKWAKRIYNRVVDAETGELAITSNAPRAVVWLDGQKVTELFESRATLMGLSIGAHEIQLRAPGFKPYIDDVIVDGKSRLSVLLEPE